MVWHTSYLLQSWNLLPTGLAFKQTGKDYRQDWLYSKKNPLGLKLKAGSLRVTQ